MYTVLASNQINNKVIELNKASVFDFKKDFQT